MPDSIDRARRRGKNLGSMQLKIARQIAGLSQGELAQRAGVSTSMICRLERGTRRHARYESLVRIAQVLHVQPTDLFPVDAPPARHHGQTPRAARHPRARR